MKPVAEARDDKYVLKIFQDEDPMNPREDDNLGTMVSWHRRDNYGDETISDPYEWLKGLAAVQLKTQDIEQFQEWCLNRYTPDTYVNNGTFDTAFKKGNDLFWRWLEKAIEKHYLMLPLSLLDHSGVHMWVGSGPHWSDPGGWDSGQVGFIYMSLADVEKEYGDRSPESIEKATKYLTGEVEEYDQYLTGDVYGFQLFEIVREPVGPDRDVERAVVDGTPVWLERTDFSCWGFFGNDWAENGVRDYLPEDARHLVEKLK
jgi:hypothetical protein